ncbi:hypothetical protein GUJ93_ZPchr0006g40921 [Zizania palustris]|uniref:Uncharacterized protein n=1 Tax=Zizania palustris TaxID=103762 RepID=A0A8J5VQW6_ZIZPA|nr:hypothetical protein GUJ93_ZPchr0006g40921 [Zizania palustris]
MKMASRQMEEIHTLSTGRYSKENQLGFSNGQRAPAVPASPTADKSTPGCSRPLDKGKGVCLPGKPTLQDFVQATTADQVVGINDQAEALEGLLHITARDVHDNANATE